MIPEPIRKLLEAWTGPQDVYVSSAALDRLQAQALHDYHTLQSVLGPEREWASDKWPVKR